MSKEIPPPDNPFGFTDREQLFDRISHERFKALLDDEQTTLHEIDLSYNNYGEFLFVTLSRPVGEKRVGVTFFGLGYHEYRERYLTGEWFWYDGIARAEVFEQTLSKPEAQERLRERLEEISPFVGQTPQSEHGKWFETLAELTDEDDALTTMEDFADFFDEYE